MKKKLLQKLAQLMDINSTKELRKDYLDLKLSDDDMFYLTMKNKYDKK
jgi:hypothetical protein